MTVLEARVAVVGHVEWVDFAIVPRLPRPGEILAARASWDEAAGGGAVAAVQIAKLCGSSLFLTALAGDHLGRKTAEQLEHQNVTLRAAPRDGSQRRGFVFLDDGGERTITVMGERLAPQGDDPLPWDELDGFDGVYFTGGDGGALRGARRASVVVATPRAGRALHDAGVAIDVLVRSGEDAGETADPEAFEHPPHTVVTTLGARGGRWDGESGSGTWEPLPLPGERVDAYGAGDSFAAGITVGLAAGMPIAEAVHLGARCGVSNLTGRGPYKGQLDLRDAP